jgi:hypothetical protein
MIRRTRQCKIGIVVSHNAVGGKWCGVHFSISLRRAHCRHAKYVVVKLSNNNSIAGIATNIPTGFEAA